MNRSRTVATLALCLFALVLSPTAGHSQTTIKVLKGKEKDQGIAVMIGGELFANVDLDNYRRPILYPIYGPDQTPMTRNYPMQKGVEGEASDHPHHKSIWCGHGLINGVSFWHEEGQIKVDYSKPVSLSMDHGRAVVAFSSNYVDDDYQLVCTDDTKITFSDLGNDARAIDWDVSIHASERDLLFGDTKEGTMAIRTHPSLRIDKGAKAENSEGIKGEGIWGKNAAWVDYSAKLATTMLASRSSTTRKPQAPHDLARPGVWACRSEPVRAFSLPEEAEGNR